MRSKMKLTTLDLVKIIESPENESLLSAFRTHSFCKGEILATPSNDEDYVFILREGKARVYLSSSSREFMLSILSPGDIFSTHTRATCQALEDGSIYLCPVNEFQKIAVTHTEFTMTMVKVLGELLTSSFSIIDGFAFRDTEKRLTLFLYEETISSGVKDGEGMLLDTTLTVEHIAQIVGASRQMVSTLLNDMYKSGLVERRGRGIFYIPDIKKLRVAAQAAD